MPRPASSRSSRSSRRPGGASGAVSATSASGRQPPRDRRGDGRLRLPAWRRPPPAPGVETAASGSRRRRAAHCPHRSVMTLMTSGGPFSGSYLARSLLRPPRDAGSPTLVARGSLSVNGGGRGVAGRSLPIGSWRKVSPSSSTTGNIIDHPSNPIGSVSGHAGRSPRIGAPSRRHAAFPRRGVPRETGNESPESPSGEDGCGRGTRFWRVLRRRSPAR
jgi:hypothetical protein